MKRLAVVAVFVSLAACSFAKKSSVVTYSQADLQRLVSEVCGPMTLNVPVHAHRNLEGDMVYLACEDHREAVVFPDSQQCIPLDKQVFDIFRGSKGEGMAQIMERSGERLLIINQCDLRGKRFDVERTGRYQVIFNGTNSLVSAVSRPYMTLLKLDLQARRIFARKRGLLVVGDNPATKMLEAHMINVAEGALSDQGAMPIGNMPAGVQVLDYSENSDELLLGGVDASGQTSFVVFDLATGQTSGVTPQKPGDDGAMFIENARLRSRLSGGASSATEGKMKGAGFLSKLGFGK